MLTSDERGIKPLLGWANDGLDAAGFSAADTIVGRGAAWLYVLLGASAVHADVLGAEARDIMEPAGIEVTCDEEVPFVINRAGTGRCPMDLAVEGVTSADEALEAIRRKVAELAAGAAS